MTGGIGIVVFVVGIVAAIMLHEWGHLASARRFGIRADRFFLGFGPTLWSTRRGETEYGVKAFPLGGFVSIKGMTPLDERRPPLQEAVFAPERVTEDRRRQAERSGRGPLEVGNLPEATFTRLGEELTSRGAPGELAERIVTRVRRALPEDADLAAARAATAEAVAAEVADTGRVGDLHHRLLAGDEGRFFQDRPAWQRAIVLVAGSAMHFVIAYVLLVVALAAFPHFTGEAEPEVAAVEEGSPADEVGLRPGDELVAVGDVRSEEFTELQQAIRARPQEPTRVVVRRDGRELELTATPRAEQDPETGETIGLLGFAPASSQEQYSPLQALREAAVGELGLGEMTRLTVRSLGQIIGPEGLASIANQVTGEEERDAETGAVSLVGAAGLAGQAGASGILLLLVSVNVFVGVFNLLPLPPLDGGHLAVLAVEKGVNVVRGARGRPQDYTVDPRAVAAVAVPVLAVFGFLMISLLWLDITSPLQLPG